MEGKSRAGELPLQEFARNIENKNVEAIEGYLANDLRYKGYTVMMIASMHTKGTWVITRFKDKQGVDLDAQSKRKLEDLAGSLLLEVDKEILEDSDFTALMLAVMFGPPETVRALIEAGARKDMKTEKGITAEMYASCREDDAIQDMFKAASPNKNKRDVCDAYWGACNIM